MGKEEEFSERRGGCVKAPSGSVGVSWVSLAPQGVAEEQMLIVSTEITTVRLEGENRAQAGLCLGTESRRTVPISKRTEQESAPHTASGRSTKG